MQTCTIQAKRKRAPVHRGFRRRPTSPAAAAPGSSAVRTTGILAAFSLLALVMASIGIYGVMSYLVVQRTPEFATRVSMGATRAEVLLRRAAALIAAGTCLGLAGSVGLVRVIAGLLFATAPLDPATCAAAPVLLAGVALAASYLPASRATRVDPMVTLRFD